MTEINPDIDIKHPIYFIDDLYHTDNKEFIYQPEQDKLFDVMVLGGIIDKREKWDTYTFNNCPVPRVSEILKETIGKEYLVKWALALGKSQYYYETKDILSIGTLVHEMIEAYLLKKQIKMKYDSFRIKNQVVQSFLNFKVWHTNMINQGYKLEPLYIEKTITCPWYGGTIDCVMKITSPSGDVKNYIIDFKSSKNLSIDYFLQTYAYAWSWNWNKIEMKADIPLIDGGIGVIRCDKEYSRHEAIFLNMDRDADIFRNLDTGFASMLNWYYHIINLNYDLSTMKNNIRKDII